MINKIFTQALAINPEGLAIVTHDGHSFSYQETEEIVLKWVQFLLDSGIQPNSKVAVLTENEDLHIFIFLALNRVGITYIPFDLDTPKVRIQDALEALACAKLIIDEHLSGPFRNELVIKINDQVLNRIEGIAPLTHLNCDPDISYILPSSGTTGFPKWIPIQGDGLLYWAEVERKLLNLSTNDRILCTRSPAYDARISEYVRAFAGAGTLFLMSHSARKDMEAILESCQKNAITCLILIASQLNQENANLFLQALKQHGLKHLMVTGDACSPILVKICEQLDISLWNCYGPTEATFGMSILRVNGLMVGNQVPIAYPLSPVQAHIVEGELYIESPFLPPQGYLCHDEEANQSAFPTLLIKERQVRVFRPGDLFAHLPNDLLTFAGRAGDDCHAKINGVKIFPFAIEQSIRAYSLTAFKAAVVIKPWQNQDKPFAYLQLNCQINKNDFRDYLAENLKKEEIPLIIILPTLPILYPSQKIDKKSLIQRVDTSEEFFFNENYLLDNETNKTKRYYYKILSEIWLDLLNLTSVSVKQDFLFSGGDSFLAHKLIQKIKEKLANNFRYSDLLKLKTITIQAITEYLLGSVDSDSLQPQSALIKCLAYDENSNANLFLLPPLFGEGYYTYRYLAPKLAEKLKLNVYGLTDPAIFDGAQLPKTLDEAARRYYWAIKTIQAQGPYALAGFSFGAILAWKVAEKFIAEGESISQLHLFDGFPPYLYQQLDKAGHACLFRSLIRFILTMLNNRYYNQGIATTNYQELDDVTPLQQVDVVFKHLESELDPKMPTYDEAKCLLALAKQHLSFMRIEKLSDSNLPIYPKLYLTDQTQPYLAVIESISSLSKHSADHRYFYWNRYFKQLRRNGTDLIVLHNELISQEKSDESRLYFRFQHDQMFNYDFDHYYFNFSYHLDKNKLSLLFLRPHQLQYYRQCLTALGLKVDVLILHKNSYNNYHRQHDSLYIQLACITADVEDEKIGKVKELLGEPSLSENLFNASNTIPQLTPGQRPLRVHLIIRCANFTVYSIDLLVYVDIVPKIREGDFFFKAKNKEALYYPNIIPDLEKESLQAAQQWLIQALLSLRPCFLKPQFLSLALTNSLFLANLCKKYSLPNTSQLSLEKGLRQAAANNRLDDLKKFIVLVKNISAQDNNPQSEKSALHWAAIKGHFECYALLLQHGAKKEIYDAQGKMPEDYFVDFMNSIQLPNLMSQ